MSAKDRASEHDVDRDDRDREEITHGWLIQVLRELGCHAFSKALFRAQDHGRQGGNKDGQSDEGQGNAARHAQPPVHGAWLKR